MPANPGTIHLKIRLFTFYYNATENTFHTLWATLLKTGFPCGSAGNESAAGDLGSIPGSGRSPGNGNGYQLQYSGLENSTDYIHGLAKSQTPLSHFTFKMVTPRPSSHVILTAPPRKWKAQTRPCARSVTSGIFQSATLSSSIFHTETPWTVAHQAPLPMGFSREEDWSGLPFPSPETLPNPGVEPTSLMSPAWAGGFFTTELPGKPWLAPRCPVMMLDSGPTPTSFHSAIVTHIWLEFRVSSKRKNSLSDV